MARLSSFFRGLFSFLGTHSQAEDRVATYVIREHRRGRDLKDILEDNYVRNRCTPAQIQRMLDQPEVIHALGESEVARVRDDPSL